MALHFFILITAFSFLPGFSPHLSFATQATALTISNVQVSTTDTTATITWTTNLPADSEIGYLWFLSKTNLIQPNLTTSHSVTLTGLFSDQSYSYTIKSISQDGQSAFKDYANFTTKAAAGSPPAPTPAPAASSSPIISPLTTATTTATALRLVNASGTFYLIIDGLRHGVTNPGMLYSYGFNFNNAAAATAQDLSLPSGSLLVPAAGTLVKTAENPTVYLISGQQRHGFVSAAVFLGLGFKWTSVLTITSPELSRQPVGTILSDSSAAHLPGTDISQGTNTYFVGPDNQRHAYLSAAIYNSWHILGDYSKVVPANNADLALPLGHPMTQRVLS